jgi:hypothetical protein
MSASPSSEAFDALRPFIVSRLLELRSSLDPALARSDEVTARAQIESVLDDLSGFIATGDLATHRAFLTAFVAKRAAEELGPSAAMSTLVAIGDTAAQVVQEQQPGGHGDELALLVARITAGSVRVVNDLIAEELARSRAQSQELRSGQRPTPRPEYRASSMSEPVSNTVPGLVYSSIRGGRPDPMAPLAATTDPATHPGTFPGTHPGTSPGTSPGTDPRAGFRGGAARRPPRTRR